MMNIESLLHKIANAPETLDFSEVMAVIDSGFSFTPTSFTCGQVSNDAGSNEGSCKILAFAKMHNLTEAQTPFLFGHYYREDVLKNPDGQDHANIRSFMKNGWAGVSFEIEPLEQR